jgi:cell division protein FtsW
VSTRTADTNTLFLPWFSSSGEKRRRGLGVDATVLAVVAGLSLVGVIMVFSASAVVAGTRFHDSIYFLKRQVMWLAVGFVVLHLASRIDYPVWRKLAPWLLGGTALLLIVVLIPSLGLVAKGARRWLRLGPFSIQPAELFKLAVVLYMASYLSRREDRLTQFKAGLLPPLAVVGLLAGLVLLQPDLGTVVVVGAVVLMMLFLAGARPVHLLGLLLATLPVAAVLILRSSYRRQRIMTFLEPWKDAADAGFQVTQSFLAFGSGGLFGVGLGEGKQKLFFLPEAHTDFVLALVGEELGLVGTTAIMLLFVVLILKGFQIAANAHEPFGRHVAMGITLLIGVQVLVNAGVVTGVLPTKGLTLPLVSYGGSSLVVSLLAVGILLSVSRDRQHRRQGNAHGSRARMA